MTKKYVFKLFLSGGTSRSEKLIEILNNLLKDELGDQHSLEIIYVTKNPELAAREKVICTPTLIKQLPPPPRRLIGHLIDEEEILAGLDLCDSKIN